MDSRLQNQVTRVLANSPACEDSTKSILVKHNSHWQCHNLRCQANVHNRFKENKTLITCSGRAESMVKGMNKLGRKADVFAIANGVREHVRLSPKMSEAVKGKLSLGARILQVGGMEKVFKHLFVVGEKERLMKASQCYLSTTAGPIAGLLFISTEKVYFCSERRIKFSCPNGETVRTLYKVVIPVTKIERVHKSENPKRPSQKYLQIVTVDNFDFWFMGFLNYQKSFKCLQQVVYQE